MGNMMGNMFDVFKKGRQGRASYVVVITPSGTAKLDKPGVPEYQWRILNHLSENGPCPIRDLARELGLEESRVKGICQRMDDDGYLVRKTVGKFGGGD